MHIRLMQVLFPISIGLGLIGGPILAYVLSRPLVVRMSRDSLAPLLVRRFGQYSGFLALPPVGFVAYTGGGSFGGSLGASLLGSFGVPLGIGLGIGLVFAALLILAALLGALCGRLFAHVVYGANAA